MSSMGVERDSKYGTVLHISCADLMDGTPILDIKPYIPFSDSHPDAADGYTAQTITHALEAEVPDELLALVPQDKREALMEVLRQDPRPSYQADPARVYGFGFAGMEVRFTVDGNRLKVCEIIHS